jgi:hypothetical protein
MLQRVRNGVPEPAAACMVAGVAEMRDCPRSGNVAEAVIAEPRESMGRPATWSKPPTAKRPHGHRPSAEPAFGGRVLPKADHRHGEGKEHQVSQLGHATLQSAEKYHPHQRRLHALGRKCVTFASYPGNALGCGD